VEQGLAMVPETLRDLRDRAMLRRSEPVALEVWDMAFDADGSGTVTVRFSKTDQAAEGHVRYLAPFAMAALHAWLDAADIPEGCLFRRVRPKGVGDRPLTDHEVARIFKQLARRVGVAGPRRYEFGWQEMARIGGGRCLRDRLATVTRTAEVNYVPPGEGRFPPQGHVDRCP